MTLPLLYGLSRSKNGDHDEILALIERGIDEGDIERIQSFVEKSGGIEYSEKRAREHTDTALSCLERYGDSAYKRSLTALTEFIVSRDR